MFRKIPSRKFHEFHNRVEGEGWWWHICAECGGKCEYHKIGSLMPGEKEFIAAWLNMPAKVFEENYLDEVVSPAGNIDILKMKQPCPFLNSKFRCDIKPVKVILCKVYPVIYDVQDEKVVYFVDSRCPLFHHRDIRNYFEDIVIPALIELDPPVEWCKAVALYDHFDYDYHSPYLKQQTGRQSFPLSVLEKMRL
jgi:hypothetical protein